MFLWCCKTRMFAPWNGQGGEKNVALSGIPWNGKPKTVTARYAKRVMTPRGVFLSRAELEKFRLKPERLCSKAKYS